MWSFSPQIQEMGTPVRSLPPPCGPRGLHTPHPLPLSPVPCPESSILPRPGIAGCTVLTGSPPSCLFTAQPLWVPTASASIRLPWPRHMLVVPHAPASSLPYRDFLPQTKGPGQTFNKYQNKPTQRSPRPGWQWEARHSTGASAFPSTSAFFPSMLPHLMALALCEFGEAWTSDSFPSPEGLDGENSPFKGPGGGTPRKGALHMSLWELLASCPALLPSPDPRGGAKNRIFFSLPLDGGEGLAQSLSAPTPTVP